MVRSLPSDIPLGRITVDDIVAPPASETPDALTGEVLERERYATETEGRKQNIQERKTYAKRIFILLSIWLFTLFELICYSGIGFLKLSDKVLITLITATTADILGIFAIVITYLFPKSKT
jgi:hypothetical protein